MEILKNWNKRVKKMSIVDLKLAQGAAILFLIVLANALPALTRAVLEVNIWIWVALLMLVGAKPFYVFWFKKQCERSGTIF